MRKVLSSSLLGSLGAVSGTTTYRSNWQPIDSFEHYMVQIVWTGTPVATVSLVVSADPILNRNKPVETQVPTNFDYVSGSQVSTGSVVVGPSGSYIVTYDVLTSSGNWIAVNWVNASGSGILTSINFVGKGSQV